MSKKEKINIPKFETTKLKIRKIYLDDNGQEQCGEEEIEFPIGVRGKWYKKKFKK